MTRKTFSLAAAALAACLSAAPAAATDIGVSIQISQPGIYGRIDIGQFPRPQVVVAQPVIIDRPVRVVERVEPVYLWVPPGHRKNWRKHCREYGACGVPVLFVQDDWYEQNVRPRGKGPGGDKGGDKGRGNGHGNGQGHGQGKGKND